MSGSEGGRRPGRTMSDVERSLRDAAIVAELHVGAKVSDVARANELTTTQVRRILRAFQERRTPLERRPTEILERVLRLYDEQIVNFAKVAAHTIESAPAVAISALRQRMEAIERQTALLAALGKLPDNLEVFRGEEELDQIALRISTMLLEAQDGQVSPEARAAVAGVRDELLRLTTRRRYDADGDAVELPPGDG